MLRCACYGLLVISTKLSMTMTMMLLKQGRSTFAVCSVIQPAVGRRSPAADMGLYVRLVVCEYEQSGDMAAGLTNSCPSPLCPKHEPSSGRSGTTVLNLRIQPLLNNSVCRFTTPISEQVRHINVCTGHYNALLISAL
jgi:hypothetical protein